MTTLIKGTPEHVRQLIAETHPEALTSKAYSGEDPRIGWKETHLVLVDGKPVGFADTGI